VRRLDALRQYPCGGGHRDVRRADRFGSGQRQARGSLPSTTVPSTIGPCANGSRPPEGGKEAFERQLPKYDSWWWPHEPSTLEEQTRNGASSGVDFQRDDVLADHLAKDAARVSRLGRGDIVLGVDDAATFGGLSREPNRVEQWVMDVLREKTGPPCSRLRTALDHRGLRARGRRSATCGAASKSCPPSKRRAATGTMGRPARCAA